MKAVARVLAVALALTAAIAVPLAQRSRAQESAPPSVARPVAGPLSAAIKQIDGTPCVGANELARLLDGAKYWRADVRKLVIRANGHRITFTADNPIVLLDDRTLRLSSPVRSLGGELQVPIEFIPMLPRDSSESSQGRLVVDANGSRLRLVPPGGYVGSPRITVEPGETRIVMSGEGAATAAVTGRDRAHLRVRLPGVFAGELPDSLDPAALVSSVRRVGTSDAVTFEFAVSPEAIGWRLDTQPGRATLVLARSGAALQPFAPESPAGPRPMRVVVLDPAHGGDDAGVQADGAVEKTLALDLAKRVATELERRGVRAVLTRADDRVLTTAARAEIANRARADVVVSLHFDGFQSPRARGAIVYCPAASFAETPGDAASGLTPWRDVATRHAPQARALAEALATSLENAAQGPARVRERLTQPLLGVNAPGVTLECATLTNAADRARVTTGAGLQALAVAITDGLLAWQRHE
ncbi:MAG: N-acetylmuramoyl-L-alanine amidase [Candidatus Eisenbacteria bacterium]|nr:N-acetylmuramoyl-L-alanine amidase [Candidatus Eisenbacteria bacterium]